MITKDVAATILSRTFAEVFWVYTNKDEETQQKIRELVKIATTNSPHSPQCMMTLERRHAIQALTEILFKSQKE